MPIHRLPTPPDLWACCERENLEIFHLALQRLQTLDLLSDDENEISKHLRDLLRDLAFEHGLDYPPKHELPQQAPSGQDKRPDFTCEVRNPSARSADKGWLYFVVECKCLGRTRRDSRNYVREGIRRFLDPGYRYGENAPSGAMVAYVMSPSNGEILEDLNNTLEEIASLGSVPPISFRNPEAAIAEAAQALGRACVSPRDFMLRHLWADF